MVDKTVMIMGAAGFIGRKLYSAFRARGYRVAGIDLSGLDSEKEDFHILDVEKDGIKGLLNDYKPECIINLIGNASVGVSLEKPDYDFRSGPVVFQKIVEAVRLYSPGTKILQISSAAVYGEPEKLPVKEDEPAKPLSPYGYNKYICELIGTNYYRNYGLRLAYARIFSAYGPGLRKQILWDLCWKCARDSSVVLNGTGEETRDFINNEDIAEAIVRIVEADSFNNDVYNVATGTSTSIRELAEIVLEENGMDKSQLEFNHITRSGDPKFWEADIEKLESIGFKAEKGLREGVREYTEWFRKDAE